MKGMLIHFPPGSIIFLVLIPILTIRIQMANIVTITVLNDRNSLSFNDFYFLKEPAEALLVRSRLKNEDCLQATEPELLM
ncbi:hypothetical protein V8C34DRAFT_298598, partial [Trichoderma compactum]